MSSPLGCAYKPRARRGWRLVHADLAPWCFQARGSLLGIGPPRVTATAKYDYALSFRDGLCFCFFVSLADSISIKKNKD